MIDWLYEHRPRWVGGLANWLFWNTSTMPSLSPYLLGIALGRRPMRMQ